MDDRKKLIMGIDTGTQPATVVVTSCSRSGNDHAKIASRVPFDFSDRLLSSLGDSLGVSHEALAADYARVWSAAREHAEFGPTMNIMRLCDPATHARINGLLGSCDRRQRKRGSRLYGQWKSALRSRRLSRVYVYDEEDAYRPMILWPSIDPEFIRELTAEKLTPGGWKKTGFMGSPPCIGHSRPLKPATVARIAEGVREIIDVPARAMGSVITNPPWAWPAAKKESDDAE